MRIAKILLLGIAILSAQIGLGDGNSKALEIARSSSLVQSHFKELLKEAGKIKDKKMREDALAILNHPEFKVVKERKPFEADIKKNLLAANLIDEKSEVFPTADPMSFMAAPGSPWRLHHCYPGGLVYHTLTNLKSALALATTYRDVSTSSSISMR